MFDITKEGDKIKRPGIQKTLSGDGKSLEVEVWNVPIDKYGSFLTKLKEPLSIGIIELLDGSKAQGFVVENYAIEGCKDISSHGGWRNYIEASS